MSSQLAPLTNTSHWLPTESDATTLFVQGHSYLGYLFKGVHFLHRIWRWQRDSAFAYHYFQNPALALGDLAVSQLAKDNPWLQTATLVAQVACSAWQAELERQAMVGTWNELIWQIRHPKILPFTAKAINYPIAAVWCKIKLIFWLMARTLLQCYRFSMHLLDIGELIRDPAARQRASYHLLTNMQFIFKQAQIGLKSLAMGHSHKPMPVFQYFGIQPSQLLSVSKHLEILTNPLKNPFALGWSAP